MILGVLLSTLHQSSLGTLYLIVPEKLYPLWYTPLLPLLFYISAIAVGLAMTIFESWHSSRAFGRALELPLLASMARVLAVVLSVYLWIRFLDLATRRLRRCCSQNRTETWLFALEIALMVVPTVLLYQRRIRLQSRRAVCLRGDGGVRLHRQPAERRHHRAWKPARGTHYVPKWSEVAVTLSIVAAGFAIFRVIGAIFPHLRGALGRGTRRREVEETEADPVAVG